MWTPAFVVPRLWGGIEECLKRFSGGPPGYSGQALRPMWGQWQQGLRGGEDPKFKNFRKVYLNLTSWYQNFSNLRDYLNLFPKHHNIYPLTATRLVRAWYSLKCLPNAQWSFLHLHTHLFFPTMLWRLEELFIHFREEEINMTCLWSHSWWV